MMRRCFDVNVVGEVVVAGDEVLEVYTSEANVLENRLSVLAGRILASRCIGLTNTVCNKPPPEG